MKITDDMVERFMDGANMGPLRSSADPRLHAVITSGRQRIRDGLEAALAVAEIPSACTALELLDALKEAYALLLAPAEDIKDGVLSRTRAAIAHAEGRA